MDDAGTPAEAIRQVRELMGQATLQRVRGQPGRALQLAQEALVLKEADWEIHEFIGDMLMGLGRGSEALQSFRRARELNPQRVELEDKLARAALNRATHLQSLAHTQAVLEGRAREQPARKPSYAAVLSIVLPGLGQIYNGQFAKGGLLLVVYLGLFLLATRAIVAEAATLGYVRQSPLTALLGAGAVWLVPLTLVWLYAIADAALCAARSRTSDGTGLV